MGNESYELRQDFDQDQVTWTSDYLAEDESRRRLARYFKTFLTAFLALGSILAVALVVLLVTSRGGGPAPGDAEPVPAEAAP